MSTEQTEDLGPANTILTLHFADNLGTSRSYRVTEREGNAVVYCIATEGVGDFMFRHTVGTVLVRKAWIVSMDLDLVKGNA